MIKKQKFQPNQKIPVSIGLSVALPVITRNQVGLAQGTLPESHGLLHTDVFANLNTLTFGNSFLSEIPPFGNIASLYLIQMTHEKRHWRRGLRDPSSLHLSNEATQTMQVGYLRQHAMHT